MWKVPVDHEMFEELNTAQWLWYYHSLLKDDEERFETNRDFVEYLASFIEPQAVQKVRSMRDKGKPIGVSDDNFTKGIEQIFGRKLDIDKAKANNPSDTDTKQVSTSNVDIAEVIKNLSYLQKPKDPSFNYRHWATVDLE